MATENLFSTQRKPALTGSQMLENAISKKATQRKNMMALTEARKLSTSTPDFTATMEAANLEADNKLKTNAMLENAQYQQGTKNIARQQLQMRPRLLAEGMDYVRNKVLGEIIYESYWLDEPVKEATVDQISDSIGKVLSYVEENFDSSKVPESKQTKLMRNVNEAIESIVKEAVDRLITEAKEANDAFTEFDLTDEEESKLDDKLCDLGKDEIVEVIKNKVAQVVQDEKEKGTEKAKMFDEIEQATQQTDESEDNSDDDTLDSTEEATLAGIRSGEITLEGATWDTLKVIFSDDKKKAKAAYSRAGRLAKKGNYKEAAKEYAIAKKAFEEMKSEIKRTDESVMSTVCSFMLAGGWLEHAFIASIGGPSSGASITKAVCASISTVLGLGIPATIIMQLAANEENTKKDKSSYSTNDYKVHTIAALDLNIRACNEMIKECNSKANGKQTTLKEALSIGSNEKFTPSERYILNIMESGAPFNAFEDPSWSEFKNYVSMMSKKTRDALLMRKFDEAIVLINELEGRLSNVPENIPADVKEFVLSMTAIIFGAVPADEVIISRMGSSMSSPDIKSSSPTIDMTVVSWIDILVNIKTNLSSIKDYCIEKTTPEVIDDGSVNGTDCPVSGRDSLAAMIATKQNQMMAQNMGGSIFEALMLSNISGTSKVVEESNNPVSDDDVEDAALIESLLQYTILETLDTLGIYKFRLADVNSIKRSCIASISEGTSPVYGDSDKDTVGIGSDNSGKKVVRINTQKMKRKTMGVSQD